MQAVLSERLKAAVLDEASRCLYCGFCEAVCPTLQHGVHRGYGPRGRVNITLSIISGERITPEALASIYSCLLCGSCIVKCPLKINVPDIIRNIRYILNSERSEFLSEVPVSVRGVA